MNLFRLSGPLVFRFLLVLCFLILLSASADAGIFKRMHERRAARHSGGCSATSSTGCSTSGCRVGR